MVQIELKHTTLKRVLGIRDGQRQYLFVKVTAHSGGKATPSTSGYITPQDDERVTSPHKMMNGIPHPIEDDEDLKARAWTRWAHKYGSRGLYLRLLDHYQCSDPLHDSLLPYEPRPCEYGLLPTAALKVLQTWALMDRTNT